jgi:putative tryptophan/tyrosine transport system substrate-binding protein
MNRRAAILVIGLSGVAWRQGLAQVRDRVARIGFLSVGEPELSLDPFREGMRQHGYVEGRNIAIEVRFATRRPDRLPEHAAALVASNVDLIVAGGSDSIRAAQRATKTIPIVMAQTSDAVGSGFVASLARPGGNVTGISSQASIVVAKRLQIVKELVPRAVTVGVLANPGNPSHPPALEVLAQAASSLGLSIRVIELGDPRQVDDVFSGISARQIQAVLPLPDNVFFNQRDRMVRLLAQARLPAVHWRKEWVEAGGLVSYGLDNPAMFRDAAAYVHKILAGAKPADLAVEQPNTFEVFVNLKAARALGLAIPQSIRLQAQRIID